MIDVRLHTVQCPGQHLTTLSIRGHHRLGISRLRLVGHAHRQRVNDLVSVHRVGDQPGSGRRVCQREVGRHARCYRRLGCFFLDVRVGEHDPHDVSASVGVLVARARRRGDDAAASRADPVPVAQRRAERPHILTRRHVVVDLHPSLELEAGPVFVGVQRVVVDDSDRRDVCWVRRGIRGPASDAAVERIRVTDAARVVLDRRRVVERVGSAWIFLTSGGIATYLRGEAVAVGIGDEVLVRHVRRIKHDAVAPLAVRVRVDGSTGVVGDRRQRGASRNPIGVVPVCSARAGVGANPRRGPTTRQRVRLVGPVVAGQVVVLLPGGRLIRRRFRREADRTSLTGVHPEPHRAAGHIIPVGRQQIALRVQLGHIGEVVVDPLESEIENTWLTVDRTQLALLDEVRVSIVLRDRGERMPFGAVACAEVVAGAAFLAVVVGLPSVARVEADLHALRLVVHVRRRDVQPVGDRVSRAWVGALTQPHGPLEIDIDIGGVEDVVPLLVVGDPIPLDVHEERVDDLDRVELHGLVAGGRAVQHDLLPGVTVRHDRRLYHERRTHVDGAEVTGELHAVVGDARRRVHTIGQTQVRNLIEERLVHRERRHDVIHRVITRRLLIVVDVHSPLGHHWGAPGDRGRRVNPLTGDLVHRRRRRPEISAGFGVLGVVRGVLSTVLLSGTVTRLLRRRRVLGRLVFRWLLGSVLLRGRLVPRVLLRDGVVLGLRVGRIQLRCLSLWGCLALGLLLGRLKLRISRLVHLGIVRLRRGRHSRLDRLWRL